MKIVIIAFSFRLLLYFGLCLYGQRDFSLVGGDAPEYYYMANNNLEVLKDDNRLFKYENWWERSPLYVLYLYILTPQVGLFLQMLISSLGVYWMYSMNKKAGVIWNFYEVGYDMIYLKEALLFSLIIFIIRKYYLTKDYKFIIFNS